MAAKSWIDFYNILTADSKRTSQGRNDNFFKLDYTGTSGRMGSASGASKKKSSDSSVSGVGKFLRDTALMLPGIGSSLALTADLFSNDEDTLGKKVIDVMSRPAYMSANYTSELMKQMDEGVLQPNLFDPDALKAGWSGLTGESKKLYGDVLRERGMGEGFARGALGFTLDVAADPTSYLGAGAAKGAVKAIRKGTDKITNAELRAAKAAEFVKDGELVPTPKAIEDVSKSAPTKATGDKTFAQFYDQFLGENKGQPFVFDDIIDKEVKPNEFGKTFDGPVELGVDSTRTVPEGGVARFKYPQGPLEEQIFSETPGPFKYERTRYPTDAEGNIIEPPAIDPDVAARGIAEMSPEELRMYAQTEVDAVREMAAAGKSARIAEEKQRQYAHLAEAGDPDLANASPLVKTIMTKVDEPVYSAYEPKEITTTTAAGRPQKFKVWVPTVDAVNNNQVMDMGKIREMLADKPLSKDEFEALAKEMADPATPMIRKQQIRARLERKPVSPERKEMLKKALANHIKAVEQWVKSGPVGYNTPAGYSNLYRELYGAAPKDFAKGEKAVAVARKKTAEAKSDLSKIKYGEEELDEFGLPKSPFEDKAPSYKEVLEYSDAAPEVKQAWVDSYYAETGLTEAHLKYLAQADSPQDYINRVWELANMVDEPTDELIQVADDIAEGKILTTDEQGIPELLKQYKVKTLPKLEEAIRKEADTLAKTNEKFLPGQDYTATLPTKEGVNAEVPKPWEARARKMAKKAKEKAAKKKAAGNKKGSEIIEDVVNGDKSAIETPKVQFDTNQQAMFNQALKLAIDKNVIKPSDKSIWQWLTRTGVAKDAPKVNVGNARVEDAWNVYSQYDFLKGLLTNIEQVDTGIKTALNQMGVRGADRLAARADYVYNLLMEPMRAMDELLKAGGIFPVAGTRQYDTPFSFFDAFSSLPEDFVKKNIFTLVNNKAYGKASRIAPTQLMEVLDIGVAAMKNPEQTDNLAELLKAALLKKQVSRKGNKIPNYMPHLAKTDPLQVDEIVDQIIDSLPELAQKVEKNAATRKLWHENQQFEGSQAALDEIAQRAMSPDYNIAEALALSNDVDPIIKAITRTKGLTPDDEFMVRAEVNAGTPEIPGLNAESRAEGKRAKNRSNTKTKKDKTKIDVAAMEEANQQSAKIMEEAGVPLSSFEDKFEASAAWKMISAIFPHWGNETIRPMLLSKSSAAQTLARTYQGLVGRIAKEFKQEEIDAAWKELQIGRWSKDERIHAAQEELNKAIGVMFSDDARYSLFNRQGLNAEELNVHFDHYKIHPSYHFEDNETMHNAWRQWDTKDPLDLLSKMFAATQKTVGKKLLGDQLMLEFGSTTKKPGYVKIANRGNEILRYIDTDTYYFPREIASQMRVLDEFLKIDLKPTYSGVGAGALRVYDSALHAYKSGLTIYRPGHHMRNMVGDVWLSYMAGVTNPAVYRDSLRVMRQMQGRYNDFDAVKALAAGDDVPMDTAKTIIAYTKVNGKRVGLTAGDIYRGMFDHGVLPDYRTLEDLQIGTEGAFHMPNVFGGRVHKVAATVSQSRDHYVRIAHGLDILKKGNFKSVEDAMEKASHTVRKWHPDGSDLSHFESKVMRRTFMFYSWIRKAIPLILEGMVMRPGRAMVYPKFMYNMAEANGIDLNSLSDPFPMDQLFPDYLSESMQGPFMTQNRDGDEHYMGIQPGIPMLDVLGDYGGDQPGRSIISSLSPVGKIPIEMTMGPDGSIAEDSRTGVPIFDKSDYLDKQIPNANLWINSTGNSLTQPTQSRGGADRDFQPDTSSAWTNFLFGLGLTDMSRSGTILQGKRDANGRK